MIDKKLCDDNTLNLLIDELAKQDNEIDSYEESIVSLEEAYKLSPNNKLEILIKEYKGMHRDKYQLVVNLRTTIKKIKEAQRRVNEVQEEAKELYNRAIALNDKKTAIPELPAIPTDELVFTVNEDIAKINQAEKTKIKQYKGRILW